MKIREIKTKSIITKNIPTEIMKPNTLAEWLTIIFLFGQATFFISLKLGTKNGQIANINDTVPINITNIEKSIYKNSIIPAVRS